MGKFFRWIRHLQRQGPSLALATLGWLLFLFLGVRIALVGLCASMIPHGFAPLARSFLLGAGMDLTISLTLTFPLVLFFAVFSSNVPRGRWRRFLFRGVFLAALYGVVFLGVADFFFFDEFNAHFNYIAVDYIFVSPAEVVGNLWQSYPLVTILSLLAGVVWGMDRSLRRFWRPPAGTGETVSWRARVMAVALWGLLGGVTSRACDIRLLNRGSNRVLNEIGANGFYTLFYALKTNNLAYDAFYPTLPEDEAVERVKKRLRIETPGQSLVRRIPAHAGLGKLNVVIVVEESLGSKFVGALGRSPSLTPELDALSKKGLFFRRIYSTGTRTVRGLEAILTSFPPIPGASIVKRDGADGVASLAQIFRQRGYQTAFVYGGRGLFDNMRHFALANGFDQFIEQKNFQHPIFKTVWGVSDEDIFSKTLDTLDALQAAGRPFFVTVLTVSNHKPYTYPRGRIDKDPDRHSRDHAVQYADWALGDFFRRAERHAFFDRTLFVVLGDHGARVYGADLIPIASYEIPLLFYAPKCISPRAVETLASSMDVAPTLLRLLGGAYESIFFGRDILADPELHYAFLQHDRDVGLMENDRLAVLGPQQSAGLYEYDRKTKGFRALRPLPIDGQSLISDAVAFYQTAYRLFVEKRYRISG